MEGILISCLVAFPAVISAILCMYLYKGHEKYVIVKGINLLFPICCSDGILFLNVCHKWVNLFVQPYFWHMQRKYLIGITKLKKVKSE